MRRISEVNSQDLTWKKCSCRNPVHELWADGEVVATLRWQGGSLAIAETAGGCWSFERPFLRRSPVSVREVESGTEMATFVSGWTSGVTLKLSRGRRIHWSAANFWRSRWGWKDGDGTPLARFESRQRLMKVKGRLRIEEAALTLPQLDLLVTLDVCCVD